MFRLHKVSPQKTKKQLRHMCYHVSPGLHVVVFSCAGGREGERREREKEGDSCAVRRNRWLGLWNQTWCLSGDSDIGSVSSCATVSPWTFLSPACILPFPNPNDCDGIYLFMCQFPVVIAKGYYRVWHLTGVSPYGNIKYYSFPELSEHKITWPCSRILVL